MFGGDTFPYGIEENRPTWEQMLRYSYEQGIAHRHAKPEEIFPEGHHDVDPGVTRSGAPRLSRRARRHWIETGYFAAVLSTSAQACATAEFGSALPGIVAQPPALT